MGLTYTAQVGTTATSYAMDETLGDQSQQTGNNTVVVSDDIIAAGNGQVIKTDYVGSLLIIDLGLSTEQTRKCIADAAGTGNTRILTVGEDWDTNPVQTTDTIHVPYATIDIDDLGGFGYSTKSGLGEFSNYLIIGNGTDPAGVQFLSEGIEGSDESSGYSIVTKNNGRLCAGYLLGGVQVEGIYCQFIQNGSGEGAMSFEAGAEARVYDSYFLSLRTQTQLTIAASASNDIIFDTCTVRNVSYEATLFDATFKNIKWSSTAKATTDVVRLNSNSVIENWVVLSTYGFTTASGDTTTETLETKNVVFIDNGKGIDINSNKTWNMINPTWDVTTYTDLDWITSTANYVYDKRSVDAVVQESDGTKLQDALVNVYEHTQLADLVQELTTDVDGVASGSFDYKLHSTNSSTTTYGGHALQCGKWLYLPFVAAQTSTDFFDGTIVLSPDNNIVQTTQATAKSAGSTITWNDETNPSSIIKYTGGSGTLAVGNTVTGGTSGADGVVTQIVDGNSVAGTVHLKTRDAVDFSGTEGLSNGSGWTATLTVSSQQDFSIWDDSQTLSLQTVYDYEAAIQNETTLTADGEKIWEWCRSAQTQPVYATGSSFYTEQSNSKGIFLVDAGAGTVDYMTDDADVQYVPPVSLTLTMTVKDQQEPPQAVVGAFAYIDDDNISPYLMNTTTNASGIATTAYIGSPILATRWRIRKYGYRPFTQLVDISTSDINLPVTLVTDPQQT